jgi:hypothetical protein
MTTKTPLELARIRAKELREQGLLQTVRRTPTENARQDPKSKTKAIKAMCYECVGGEGTTNWRDEIKYCNLSSKCPLYPHRPYKTDNEKSY